MNRESVIITSIAITQPGQVKLFQVKIPREVEHIIGIEMGMQWRQGSELPAVSGPQTDLMPLAFQQNVLVGELKLQSYERARIFYAGELLLNRNMAYADFTQKWFSPKVYSHQHESHAEEIKVSGRTTLIQGVYRDQLNNSNIYSYRYNVNVYVWTETKEQPEKKAQ